MKNKFPYFPASERDMGRRKKNYGIAINDAPYITSPTVDGKVVTCPYFKTWRNMLDRAYSECWKKRRPSLEGVTVCEEWLHFMNFRDWMERQLWEGRYLDKDILIRGNKEYSPSACAFILNATNRLMNFDHNSDRLLGADFHMGRWRALYSGKYLGHYDTQEQAHTAWKAARAKALVEAAMVETDPRVPPVLLRYAAELLQNA